VVVLDNLGEGVLKPDIYDPTLNPVYADMLRHYGVVAMPCRVADPDRKAWVSYCTPLGRTEVFCLRNQIGLLPFELPRQISRRWFIEALTSVIVDMRQQ
jgi:hypothetical protein